MFTAFLKNHLFLFEFWRKWESLWDVVGSLFSWNRRVNRCVKLWHRRSEIQRVFWRHHSFPCFKNKNKTRLTNKQTIITDINICSSQWDGNQVTKLGWEHMLDTWLHRKDRVFSLPPKTSHQSQVNQSLGSLLPKPTSSCLSTSVFPRQTCLLVSRWEGKKQGFCQNASLCHSPGKCRCPAGFSPALFFEEKSFMWWRKLPGQVAGSRHLDEWWAAPKTCFGVTSKDNGFPLKHSHCHSRSGLGEIQWIGHQCASN